MARKETENLCEWADNENYNKAYELWVKYQYECERWDESVCTGGRDRNGFVRPALAHERSSINEFAFKKRNEIMALAVGHRIPPKEMNRAKQGVSRLTLDELEKEYNRIWEG